MNTDDTIVKLTLMIAAMGAFVFPFLFFISAFTQSSKMLGQLGKSVQNGMQRAANAAGRAGKKAAMNSKYGQAAQQFMGNRKSIKAMKGREALAGALEKNPNLMKLMGGGKYAARYLDAEQRRHDTEQVSNLKQGLTSNVANALASRKDADPSKREDISRALTTGKWSNGSRVEDTDRVAVRKLQQEGYMDQNYNVKDDSRLARAALGSIMDAEIAKPDNIKQLASMVGTDARENALFTEALQSQAQAHGYKNLQYASVSGGHWDPTEQYHIKSSGNAEEGAKKVVQSGLSGINKDALDPTQDMSLLNAIKSEYDTADKAGRGDAFIRKIAEQTRHIDKDSVVEAIAAQMPSVSLSEFQDLRASIKSGGAVPAPARFAGGGTPTPAPAPAPTTPPPPGYQQVPGSPLVVPHGSLNPPAPAPAPAPTPAPAPAPAPSPTTPPAGPTLVVPTIRPATPPRPRGGNFNGPGNGP